MGRRYSRCSFRGYSNSLRRVRREIVAQIKLHFPIRRSVAQIPQCIRQISHNAPFCSQNVHTCDICPMHCGICEMGLLDTPE